MTRTNPRSTISNANLTRGFSIEGVAVTTTAAELNAAAGTGLSAEELGFLDGATAGTAVASKAAVLGANKNIDTIVIAASGLKIGAGAGTAMTATAAELNVNAGVVAGTVTASKTLVVGADKNLDVLALPVSGLKIGAGAGTAVTASAAELNKLTGSGATVASGTQVSGITDAVVAHALNSTFSDTEAEAALDALGTKINLIIAALEAYGISAVV